MFTIDDIDDDLTAGVETPDVVDVDGDEAETLPTPAPLTPDSPTSQALWRVWSGAPVTIVDSPPGGGKSESVATICAHLSSRAGLKMVVVTPTRRAAKEIAARIAQQVPRELLNFQVTGSTPPEGVFGGKRTYLSGGSVTVRTLASCKRSAPVTDLLVVDEAYQCTFADVAAAANKADQVLMVGDPGQIGPVVTIDTYTWDRMKNAPHRRAPEAFVGRPDTDTVHIDKSYRLGQATVEAIAPLYDFPFTSGRIDRKLIDRGGVRREELESVVIESNDSADDLAGLTEVAKLAAGYVGSTRLDTTDSGTASTVLTQDDIAVVVSHNSQSNIVSGLLGSLDCGDIAVGTADRLQGGQWSVVVALDPSFGYAEAGVSSHMMAMGRLCVMSSRHTTHLLWVHDDSWRELFAAEGVSPKIAATAIKVREALTANDVTTATSRKAARSVA